MKAAALVLTISCLAVSSLALSGLAFSVLAATPQAEERIELMTESYPPYSYRDEDGSFKGIGIDQVDAVMRDVGLDYGLEMLPWARAIALAETQVHTCVFTAARTAEREARFKWVVTSTSRNILVRNAASPVRVATIEEAKPYLIGTHRRDYTEDLLNARGFPNIDLSADFDATLRKLLEQRIDMMPMSEMAYDKLRQNGIPVEKVMMFAEQQFGIACHPDIDDATIEKIRTGYARIAQDGRQAIIYRRYGLKPPD